ncbi:MAG: choice-of-anchor D domain-containing protein [Bacteroidia bacterium]|nr:choice-of-anchor D domain-containing protein [Bacteroidia bacterium]
MNIEYPIFSSIGTIAYYPFSGNADDASGNGNNGTVYGPVLTSDRFGIPNSAYQFNGGNDYIQFNGLNVNTNVGGKNTVSFWMFWNGNEGMMPIGWNNNYDLYFASGLIGFNSGQGNIIGCSYSGLANTWVNVVAVFFNGVPNTTDNEIYINGVKQTLSGGASNYVAATSTLFASGWGASGGYKFNGKIDEILVYNHELSQYEIDELYNTGGISYHYHFNWSTGDTTAYIQVAPTEPTTYYLTVSDGLQSCIDSVTVNTESLPVFALTDTIVVPCGTHEYMLDAGEGYSTYLWSTSETTRSITVTSSGNYSATVNGDNGCASSAVTYVSIIPSMISYDETICAEKNAFFGYSFVNAFVNDPDLMAYYPFNGDLNDYSGHGNNGTNNGVTFNADRFSDPGMAGQFYESNYLMVNTSSSLEISGNISLAAWINPSSYSSYNGGGGGMIVTKLGQYYMELAVTGQIRVYYYGLSNPGYHYSNAVVPLNTWTHVATSWDGQYVRIYINGVEDIAIPLTGSLTISGSQLEIGSHSGGSYDYAGRIDEVNIFRRALTASEIMHLMNAGGNYTYTWSDGSTTASLNVSPLVTTNYYVTVSDGAQSCTDSITINVNQLPVLSLLDTVIVSCGNINYNLFAGEGYSAYMWNTGQTTSLISVGSSGNYMVTVTDNNGCNGSDASFVSIIPPLTDHDQNACYGSQAFINYFIYQDPALVAYYPFNGNAQDMSGMGHDGTVNGATLVTDRFGNPNSAYFFNGSANIDLANTNNLNFTGAYSLSAWAKFESYQSDGLIVAKHNCGYVNGFFLESYNGDLSYYEGSGSRIVTPNPYNDNNWHMITGVFDGTTQFLYVDGQLINSQANTPVIPNSVDVKIGMGTCAGFTGTIDDVLIFSRALSSTDVSKLFTGTGSNYSYTWSDGQSTGIISVSPAVTTTYYVTVTDGTQTCNDSSTVHVSQLPQFALIDTILFPCGSTTAQIDAGAGFTSYNWSSGETGQVLNIIGTGLYKVTVTDSNGCSSNDSIRASFINMSILQQDTSICPGTSVQLSTTGVIPYISQGQTSVYDYDNFEGGPGSADDWFSRNGYDPDITNSTAYTGNYSLHMSEPWGGNFENGYHLDPGQAYGFYTDDFPYMSMAYKIPSGTLNNMLIYVNNYGWRSVTMTQGETPCSYPKVASWNANGNLMADDLWHFKTINLRDQMNTILGTGNYYISAVIWHTGGCLPGPSGEFWIDDFSITSLPPVDPASTYSLTWSTGETTLSITVTPQSTETYYLTVTDGIQTCTDSVTVNVNPVVEISMPDTVIADCSENSVMLNAGEGHTSYLWNTGETTESIYATHTGKYFVTVSDNIGCSKTDSTFVSVAHAEIVAADTVICTGGSVILSLDNQTVNGPAISDFTYYGTLNNHLYYMSNYSANWWVANAACQAAGGHLVTISSTAENNYVTNIPGGSKWLGLTDQVTVGVWQWVTGEPVTYTNWNSGEPNNPGAEDYTQSNVNGNMWNNLNGYSNLPFVLEFDWNPQISILWSTGDTTSSISVSPLATTDYSVTITDGLNTCSDHQIITVNPLPQITITSDGNTNPCAGGHALLSVDDSYQSYQWKLNGNDILNAQTSMYIAQESGTYTVNVLTSCGWVLSSEINVNVIDPLAGITGTIGSNSPVCEYNTLYLTAPFVDGATYQWTGPSGFSSTEQNPLLENITLSGEGNYSVVITYLGCSSSPMTTYVEVDQQLVVFLGNDTTIFSGSSLTLNAGPGGTSYLWSTGAGTQSISVSAAGTYSVTVTNACGSFYGMINVSVINPPQVSITPTDFSLSTDYGISTGSFFDIFNLGDASLNFNIQNVPSWLTLSNYSGILPGGDYLPVNFTTSSTLTGGDYYALLYVYTNDPGTPVMYVQIHLTVYEMLMYVSPMNLNFGNVVKNTTATADVYLVNYGNIDIDVTSISTLAPFTVGSYNTLLPAGQTMPVVISFTPTATLIYSKTLTINTSFGDFNVGLQGTGANPAPSWSFAFTNYDFGYTDTATGATTTLAITNTGNVPVTVTNTNSTSSYFTIGETSFTIPVGSYHNVTLGFYPNDLTAFNAVLSFTSNNCGVQLVTVTGTGMMVTSPPTLTFVPQAPFNGVSGVDPTVGPSSQYFTYKVVYTDPNNYPPMTGYPRLAIDRNGDHDFLDPNEGFVSMSADSADDVNYMNGKTYTLVTSFPVSAYLGYEFEAFNIYGDAAIGTGTEYHSGPLVSNDMLDLYIYADDINFSDATPAIGQVVNISATIHNNSDYPADMPFEVEFWKEDTLMDTQTVPSLGAHTSLTLYTNQIFTYPEFYPIKVVIDPAHVLDEGNILNNFAIRPLIAGEFSIPGAIEITASISPQDIFYVTGTTPPLMHYHGHAAYVGSFDPNTNVSGATVSMTLAETGMVLWGYTNTYGDFDFYFYSPVPGEGLSQTYHVSSTCTDYTLTGNSDTLPYSIHAYNLPHKPDLNAYHPTGYGWVPNIFWTDTCILVGEPIDVSVYVWNSGDSTAYNVKFFGYKDDPSDPTFVSYYDSLAPGEARWEYFTVTFDTEGDHSVGIWADPDNTIAEWNENNNQASVSRHIYNTDVDLIPSSFWISSTTPLDGQNVIMGLGVSNTLCYIAGTSIANLYDIYGNDTTLIASLPYPALGPMSGISEWVYNYSFHGAGIHTIMAMVDYYDNVSENNEDNNIGYWTINVPVQMPDLTFTAYPWYPLEYSLGVSSANVNVGDEINFTAGIQNYGNGDASNFYVRFKIDNVLIGSPVFVPFLGAGQSMTLYSDPWTITDCGHSLEVVIDEENLVAESNENNNFAEKTNIGVDLAPSTPGGNGWAGSPVIIGDYVWNNGAFTADSIPVYYYCTNCDPNNNHLLLGVDVIPNVPASSYSYSHIISTFNQPGTYQIYAYVDTTRYCELTNTNNTAWGWVYIWTERPDLVVYSYMVSPTELNPDPGESINIYSSFENNSNISAGPFKVQFLMDSNPLGDLVQIPGMYAHQDTTVACTQSWSSTVIGPHIIRVVLDVDNEVIESDESNNMASRAVIVGDAPDMKFANVDPLVISDYIPAVGEWVTITAHIKDIGGAGGNANARFYYINGTDSTLIVTDNFNLSDHDSLYITIPWQTTSNFGKIACVIGNCVPMEFNLFNNSADLLFGAPNITLTAQLVSSSLDICSGSSSQLMVIASGGSGNYTVTWTSDPEGLNYTGATLVVSPVQTTIYTASVTDGYSTLLLSATVHVTETLPAELNGLNVIYCINGAPSVLNGIPDGGVFSGDGMDGSTFYPQAAGIGEHLITYTYMATSGCISTATAITTVLDLPHVTLNIQNVSCNGGNNGAIYPVVTNVPGNPEFNWSNGESGNNVTDLSAGTYYLIVSFEGMCSVGASAEITEPDQLSCGINITYPELTQGYFGTLESWVSGGVSPYTYLWSGGETTSNETNLASGYYSLTITDANGCSCISYFNATVSYPPEIVVSPESISVSVSQGSTGSAMLHISNTGSDDLLFSISDLPTWLTLSLTSGMISNGSTQDINFTFSNTLPGGSYSAHLHIHSNDPLNPVIDFPVYLTVFGASMYVNPTTIDFGGVVKNTTATNYVNLVNNGNLDININSITAQAPYSVGSYIPVLPAGQSIQVAVNFSPTATVFYNKVMNINTSFGNFVVNLHGVGVNPAPAWTFSFTDYDYGFTDTATGATVGLVITNTGNVPVLVTNIVSSNPHFSVTENSFNLPVNSSHTLQIAFNPDELISYVGLLSISSNNCGNQAIHLNGYGMMVTTPPQLTYEEVTPFNGVNGVDPAVGPTSAYFTYKVVYTDPDNYPPFPGFPKIGIDRNGDGDFLDPEEGWVTMSPEDPGDLNYADGKTYVFNTQFPLPFYYGYSFRAFNIYGNAAIGEGTNYHGGPLVSNDMLDLSIYANDINFSNPHPALGQEITIWATIHNTSDYPADQPFEVQFWKEDTLMGTQTVNSLDAHTDLTLSMNETFTYAEFYPIKVIVDATNVIAEDNELNNFAIRPIIAGEFSVPGSISVTASISPGLIIVPPYGDMPLMHYHGHADYVGAFDPATQVSGAEVTFVADAIVPYTTTTFTNSNGDFDFYFVSLAPPQGDTAFYHAHSTVTDYTLTSTSGYVMWEVINPTPPPPPPPPPPLPKLPDLNCWHWDVGCGCWVQNILWADSCIMTGEPIDVTVWVTNTGDSTAYNVKFYGFKDGYPDTTFVAYYDSLAPGYTRTEYFTVTFDTPGEHYVGIWADPDNHIVEWAKWNNIAILGRHIYEHTSDLVPSNLWASDGAPMEGQDVLFGLSVSNILCDMTGPSTAFLYDAFNGDTTLMGALDYPGVPGMGSEYSWSVNYAFSGVGLHTIIAVVDALNAVAEENEYNNTGYWTINVLPYVPDLAFYFQPYHFPLQVSSSDASPGDQINFTADIINDGTGVAENFFVTFKIDDTIVGDPVFVPILNPGEVMTVTSDIWTLTPCHHILTVVLDEANNVQESNENNNILSRTDIGVDNAISPPGGGGWPNTTILVGSYIYNYGTFNTDSMTVSYYCLNCGPDEVFMGSDVVPVVPAGGFTFSYILASFPDPGTYFIKAYVDSTKYCETLNSNNVAYGEVNILTELPNLLIHSSDISPTELNPDPNESIQLYSSMHNTSNVSSGPFKVLFEVDSNPVGDTILVPDLGPHMATTVACSDSWSSPLIGPHIVRVFVDVTNMVAETDELDNEASRAVIVGDAPDMKFSIVDGLVMTDMSPALGQWLTLTAHIKNIGGASGSANASFYLVNGTDTSLLQVQPFDCHHHDSIYVTIPWQATTTYGKILCVISDCTPMEFNLYNNTDELIFGTPGSELQAAIHASVVNLCAGYSSQLLATYSGGSGIYTVTWTSQPEGLNYTGDALVVTPSVTTTYTATVSDGYSTVVLSVTIQVTTIANVDFTGLDQLYCINSSPVVLTGTPDGGYFSGDGIIDNIFDPSAAGVGPHEITYTYTSTEGCSGSVTKLTEVMSLPESHLSIQPVSCYGANDGSVFVVVNGSDLISYLWSNGETTHGIYGLDGGVYSVTVFYEDVCQIFLSGEVYEPAPLSLTLEQTVNPTNGYNSIDLSITGGTSPYSILWSDGSTDWDIQQVSSGTYSVTVYDAHQCSATDSININLLSSQTIYLNLGWNLYSTYINPVDPEISTVLSPVISNLIIAKNNDGQVYWPLYNVDQIGPMVIGDAYYIKMSNNRVLTITGTKIEPQFTPLPMPQNWNSIAYLRDSSAPIADMLSGIVSNITIVVDGGGHVYWPSWGLNHIGNMTPGLGYHVDMSAPGVLLYPEDAATFEKAEVYVPEPVYYTEVNNTGNYMILGIPASAWTLSGGIETPVTGDEIGVFDESGVLVGSGVYEGINTVVTVWGDDETTPVTDGLLPSGKFSIRLWHHNLQTMQEIKLTVAEWTTGNDSYSADKISIVKSFVSAEVLASPADLYQNIPNPFKDVTSISFYIPSDSYAEISIFNVLGEKLETILSKEMPAGKHTIMFDATNYPSGSYFYRLITNGFTSTKELNVVK